MLPHHQNSLLFGETRQEPPQAPDMMQILIKHELESMLGSVPDYPDYLETKTLLPDLRGYSGPRNALEAMAGERWAKHIEGLKALAVEPPTEPPKNILVQAGWTHYPRNGEPCKVDHPPDTAFLYDTETYVRGGGHPVIGVAASLTGWYIWLHPQICLGFVPDRFVPVLIPLGSRRCVIAHSVMFDLSKSQEAYELGNQNRPVGFCTMAAHGAIASLGGDQVRNAFKAIPPGAPYAWLKKVAGDSLQDCLKYYVGMDLNKDRRDLFVSGTLGDIIGDLPNLLDYAVKDVEALWWLFMALWPKFREACPSDASLVGLLELSRSLLVVRDTYDKVIAANNLQLEVRRAELLGEVTKVMNNDLQAFMGGKDWSDDPWLSQLDWTPAKSGENKGWPAWWRKLKGHKLTLGSNALPLFIRATWQGHPLVFVKKKGWGFHDPEQDGKWVKLPHPDGPNNNVGSPLAKAFMTFAEKGILSSTMDVNLPKELSKLSYWVSYQKRFAEEYKGKVHAPGRLGIVPHTKLLKTLTGRQVHKTWLTAAQCKKGKLGSDFFHVIQPPEGWSNILWDEDTEEVRIAALWGDLNRGMGIGATAMSQIAFMGENTGNLATATDAHSVTARLAGMERKDGKIFNFQDIFGGGKVAQSNSLRSAHGDWSAAKIDKIVSQALLAKRGRKVRGVYEGGTDSFYHNQAANIANTPDFRLPASGRLLPNVINPRYDTTGKFYMSRFNFPVQGTGVDILHFTAAAVGVLCDMHGIPETDYGYVMARHDEIAYNVKDEHSKLFAEIANAAHCWAWAIYLDSLGFGWMPTPLARLSGINIDKVYRKEVEMSADAGYGTGWDIKPGFMVR